MTRARALYEKKTKWNVKLKHKQTQCRMTTTVTLFVTWLLYNMNTFYLSECKLEVETPILTVISLVFTTIQLFSVSLRLLLFWSPSWALSPVSRRRVRVGEQFKWLSVPAVRRPPGPTRGTQQSPRCCRALRLFEHGAAAHPRYLYRSNIFPAKSQNLSNI